MNVMIRPGMSVAIALLALAVSPCALLAQSASPGRSAAELTKARGRLDIARTKYERDMEALRANVQRALVQDGNINKGKDAEITRINRERDDFRASGQFPTRNHGALEQEYAKYAEAMRKAYTDAKSDFGKYGTSIDVAAITQEADEFWKHWDAAPWSGNLIEKKSEAERMLKAGGEPLSVPMSMPGGYRLDVTARRNGEAASLTMEIPLPDGKRAALAANPATGGRYRVILTVGTECVCADLGVDRPIVLGNAASGGRELRLKADGGECEILSVLVKPLGDHAPPAISKTDSKEKSKPRNPEQPADELRPGDKLLGNASVNNHAPVPLEGTVERISDTELAISVKRDGGGFIHYTFARNGGSLTLTDQRAQGGDVTYKNSTGSGSLNGVSIEWTSSTECWRGSKLDHLASGHATLSRR